ncbi:putative oxidoreductase [Streptomyces sp. NBRC 110611]|uniref:FAD-dependent monooxygenase n=1 Tax=Streptomyces sp. NBRC 110611 TaxID=1621259 RepID=UPI0008581174|nr:FAD-dependent monooxygenase [Streptomyces sp. NBRC 110611]GAU68341.1 putative oxidoreductase [Streptomyces sp. NBRC 110611]
MLNIAIIGAGIGGLTAAIALREKGHRVNVYEQTSELRAIGAGFGVLPNAMHLLATVGLDEGVQRIGYSAGTSIVRDWAGNRLPVENWPQKPSPLGSTYAVHRGEFQQLLVSKLPAEALHLGKKAVKVHQLDDSARVDFGDGTSITADLVIGADGIRTAVQEAVGVEVRPTGEGIMAYRALVPIEKLSWALEDQRLAIWFGPQRTFLCYLVSSGKVMNVVGYVPSDRDAAESWSAPGALDELRNQFEGWEPRVLETIDAAESTFKWGIFDRPSLPRWSTRSITLLGDAAHAMVPHLGQGANQAMEDAFALATILDGADPGSLPELLKVYEGVRIDRTSLVQRVSREAGRLYRDFGNDDMTKKAEAISDLITRNHIAGYDAIAEAAAALARR